MITFKTVFNLIKKANNNYLQICLLCISSYIGQTSRLLKIRIREHTSKIISHISNKETVMNAAVKNAIKRASIAEHLIYNPIGGDKYMNFQYLKSY